jgi:hypothetical protein
MPVPPTEDNPNGWGYIEKRKVLEFYQLSPRIQIVIGDVIKVTQGDYYMKDGGRVTIGSMQGKWRVDGIFEKDGEVEMAIRQVWSGGMLGQSDLIRITGEERPSKILPHFIINRPHKIKLAVPRHKRKTKIQREIGTSYVSKPETVEEPVAKKRGRPKGSKNKVNKKKPGKKETNWAALADIVNKKTKES